MDSKNISKKSLKFNTAALWQKSFKNGGDITKTGKGEFH
jgi:hypothetical protein